MSDSDDTDVLLLIPPDLFLVPSSDSEDHSDSYDWQQRKSGVVSELIDHMQTLESRISVIESRDSPNNTLNLSRQLSLDSIMSGRQTIPRTKFSVSRHSSLQSTPTKASQCFSLPSTPNIHQKSNYSNKKHYHPNLSGSYQSYKRDSSYLQKHDHSKSFSESLHSQHALPVKSALHAGIGSPGKETSFLPSSSLNVCENNISHQTYKSLSTGHYDADHKFVKDISLPEVNKLLTDIESNDKHKISKNHNCNGYLTQINTGTSDTRNICEMKGSDKSTNNTMDQDQKLFSNNRDTLHESMSSMKYGKQRDRPDGSVLDSSFSSFDTDRFMTDFKSWNPSFSQDFDSSKITKIDLKNFEDNEYIPSQKPKGINEQVIHEMERNGFPMTMNFNSEENRKESNERPISTNFYQMHADTSAKSQILSSGSKSCPSVFKTPSNFHPSGSLADTTELASNIVGDSSLHKNSTSDLNENDPSNKRPQRLLTLSDIWNQDSSKPEEERLRQKLEEEKFRREHCEQLIQELQKKLLEQQEKIAVAIRVDNEKNSFISQFQVSWKKMRQKLYELESERENFQKLLKVMSEKHKIELVESQKQIVKYKEELSKAINLASDYKEKSDAFVKEKVELLKNHADELQNYQTLVQQSEQRYETMKTECQRLSDKNKEMDDNLKDVQDNLSVELLKSSEVKNELSVIHKALDACEAELVILRQEKDNLQIMLKEEKNRNNILEKGNQSLTAAVEEAKQAEKLAMNEVKALTEQQEKLRSELRDVYQKQVDEVVKTKLHEFQTQLDSAEAVFQNEVETKQRAIAECAARKIKSVMDKHQLEIHLVEEKHKEEKKLFEIKIAQAVQKAAILETQLNSYRKSKSQLVEQLYSMLQKQWQQALVIISGNNSDKMSSFQKLNVDKLFELPNGENVELIPEHCSTLCTDPIKSGGEQKNVSVKSLQAQEVNNESLITLTSNEDTPLSSRKESKSELKKYIKMILDMQHKDDFQKPNGFNDNVPSSQHDGFVKQALGRNRSTANEGNSKWEPISEVSIHDTSEYLSPPQKFAFRNDSNEKPPWK